MPGRRSLSSFLVAITLLCSVALIPAPRAGAVATTASDSFDRNVSSGWGQAKVGGAWTVTGGTKTSVVRGSGLADGIKPGHTFRALLNSVVGSDQVVSAEVQLPTTPGIYSWVEARHQTDGSYYAARVRLDSSQHIIEEAFRSDRGAPTLLASSNTGVVARAGQAYRIQLQISGTSAVALLARVNPIGEPAPDWTVSANDASAQRISGSGPVGIGAYLSTGNHTAEGVQLQVSDFSATGLVPSHAPLTPTPSASLSPSKVGSLPVGSARYVVPGGSVFVSSSTGDDKAAGGVATPLKTVGRAIAVAKAGGTIVLRAGVYHESVIVPPSTPLTIENYPGEAAWFDGARVVSGFTRKGLAWAASGWTARFDSSPTDTAGAPDGTSVGYTWINPHYPLAAHPDQVWVSGVEQTQVGSVSALRAGAFYVDYSTRQLYLGSDPTGKLVEASDLSTAISLRAPGTVLRGFGVRRYADSVSQQGVITSYRPLMRLENIVVRDSATAGIGLYGANCRVSGVTVSGSGEIGLQAGYADGLVVDNTLLYNSNDQHFNPTPAAGGFKITTTRGVTFRNSEITGTDGNAFWADQSNYNLTLIGNDIHDNGRWGVVIEISSLATIADNLITGNAHDGILVANSDRVSIWNNTLVGNRRAVEISQDPRRITDLSIPGHDERRKQPDLSMPWVTRSISLGNNVLGGTAGADSILDTESYDHVATGSSMIATSNGNVYTTAASDGPAVLIHWAKPGGNGAGFPTLAAAHGATHQEASSATVGDISRTEQADVNNPRFAALTDKVAQPLPANVAKALDRPAGSKHLGAWS